MEEINNEIGLTQALRGPGTHSPPSDRIEEKEKSGLHAENADL